MPITWPSWPETSTNAYLVKQMAGLAASSLIPVELAYRPAWTYVVESLKHVVRSHRPLLYQSPKVPTSLKQASQEQSTKLTVQPQPQALPVIDSFAAVANHVPGWRSTSTGMPQRMHLLVAPPTRETVCADTGCGMSLIDRDSLHEYDPTADIIQMPVPVRVKSIGNKLHNASSYTQVDFYFLTINGCIAHFRRQFHIVDGREANALL